VFEVFRNKVIIEEKGTGMKKIVVVFAFAGILFCHAAQVFAKQSVGVVDMAKILTESRKAQEVTGDIKSQQDEIQQMITEARNKISSATSEEQKKDLDKMYTDKIQQKNISIKSEYDQKVTDLRNSIAITVEKVAKHKKMDLIFSKDDLVYGGQDITNEVISRLNK